jgi:nucleotide-binding universal stress UspA family protein
MFGHVLVAVDGSEHAARAIATATDLALRYDARLTLIHVSRHANLRRLHEDLLPLEQIEHVQFTRHDLLELVEHDILDVAEQRARDLGATEVDTETRIGSPADEIANFAAGAGVDLIVTGTRGLSNLPGMVLGSVSHRIIHLAEIPVLVVH